MNRIEQMKAVQDEGLELFTRKNKDYGDAFAKHGTIGVLIRMSDKIDRCLSVSNSGVNLVHDEALRDTLIDLHNYSAMAIMLMDEDDKKIPVRNVSLPESHIKKVTVKPMEKDISYGHELSNVSSDEHFGQYYNTEEMNYFTT
tara:strand:- start:4150 stop:4578 length:429 start_codon:yes stop_codon:yes gene_type:complete